jgi:hypothetical protein
VLLDNHATQSRDNYRLTKDPTDDQLSATVGHSLKSTAIDVRMDSGSQLSVFIWRSPIQVDVLPGWADWCASIYTRPKANDRLASFWYLFPAPNSGTCFQYRYLEPEVHDTFPRLLVQISTGDRWLLCKHDCVLRISDMKCLPYLQQFWLKRMKNRDKIRLEKNRTIWVQQWILNRLTLLVIPRFHHSFIATQINPKRSGVFMWYQLGNIHCFTSLPVFRTVFCSKENNHTC